MGITTETSNCPVPASVPESMESVLTAILKRIIRQPKTYESFPLGVAMGPDYMLIVALVLPSDGYSPRQTRILPTNDILNA